MGAASFREASLVARVTGPTRWFATLHFMSASHSAETTASDGISRMVIAMYIPEARMSAPPSST